MKFIAQNNLIKERGRKVRAFGALVAKAAIILGCASGLTSCATSADSATSGSAGAASSRQLNEMGMKSGNSPERAAELFAKAVAADPFNAAAHNNLGAALMDQGDLYGAAQQFQEAIRLLPGNPEPRVNLGLLYEQVDEFKNAQEQYEQALTVAPEYLPALQAMARVRVNAGQLDESTAQMLHTIALRATDPAWHDWAQLQLTRSGFLELTTTQLPTTQPVMSPSWDAP